MATPASREKRHDVLVPHHRVPWVGYRIRRVQMNGSSRTIRRHDSQWLAPAIALALMGTATAFAPFHGHRRHAQPLRSPSQSCPAMPSTTMVTQAFGWRITCTHQVERTTNGGRS